MKKNHRIPEGLKPEFVDKPTAAYILGSTVYVKRALYAKMVLVIRQGGRGSSTLIDYRSLVRLADKIRSGFVLPLLPSEKLNG